MRRFVYSCIGVALVALGSTAQATTFRFDTAPFGNIDVQHIPGRQIVGGEKFISFSVANDVFSLESTVFDVTGPLHFVNSQASLLPTGGVNVVVLQTFDNDNNPLTPFGAGNAADLIADRVTTPGAGFFIYFNQSLDMPRLVYSTDLSDHNADLQILARMLNLPGQQGRDTIPRFTASNFELTNAAAAPEPSSFVLIMGAAMVIAGFARKRKPRS